MNKQHGGAFRVSGYIALALLSLALCEAGYIRHLLKHRQIVIEMNMKQVQTPITLTPIPDDDYGVVHTFPPNRQVCTGYDTICYNRI